MCTRVCVCAFVFSFFLWGSERLCMCHPIYPFKNFE